MRVPALAVGACRSRRSPASRSGSRSTLGDEEANLLLPLYAVVAALAARARLAAPPRRRAQRASSARSPCRSPRSSAGRGLSLALVRRPARGRDLPPRLRPPVRAARDRLRAAAVGASGRCSGSTRGSSPPQSRSRTSASTSGLTRDVFWNPKVIVGNAYAPFYRVNSVFWDPSIYGRYLVVAILATLALVAARRCGGRDLALAIILIATLWVGPALLVLSVELRGADRRRARRGHGRLAAGARPRRSGWPPSARHGRLRDAAGADTRCSRSRERRSTTRRAAAQASSATASASRATTRSRASASAASSAPTPTAPGSKGT